MVKVTHSDGLVSMFSDHKNPELLCSSPKGPVWDNLHWATEKRTKHIQEHYCLYIALNALTYNLSLH